MAKKYHAYASLQVEIPRYGYGLQVEIYRKGRILGTLIVGRGSVGWKKGKKQKHKWLYWKDFAKLAEKKFRGPS